MMRELRFDDLWRRRLPGVVEVGLVAIDPIDGASVLALRTGDDDRASLVRWAAGDSSPVVLVGPDDEARPTEADELEAQRLRRSWDGVSSFRLVGTAGLAVSTGGRWSVVDRTGRPVVGYDLDGAVAVATCAGSDRVVAASGSEVWLAGPGERQRLAIATDRTIGLADYIAQEEFDRHDGLWLSPNGRSVAWTVVDESKVPEHLIVHHGPFPERVERHRYPFVGAANAVVEIAIATLDGGGATIVDLPIGDGYLVEALWLDDETFVAGILDRAQHELTRWRVSMGDGEATRIDREHHEPWVDVPGVLIGADGVLVTRSQRFDGFWRVTAITDEGARALAPALVATAIVGVVGGSVVAIGYVDDPTRRSLWRVPLDGSSPDEVLAGGVFGVAAAGDRAIVAVRSSVERAPELLRIGADLEVLVRSEPEVVVPTPRLVEADFGDGVRRYAAVYQGEGSTEGRPLVLAVYGGPHVQLVQDAWSLTADLTCQWLARSGAVVVKLDGRGSANRGRAFEEPIARGFGTVELDDQLAAIDWAAAHLGIDTTRVGIFGWSYGGYLTLLATSRHPSRFRVGVAGAPVVDFRWYDTGYTERYLGLVDDPRYEQASVLHGIEGLAGPDAPKVLVIHGMVDENVHVGHSLRLLERAAHLGIDLRFLPLLESRHGPRRPDDLEAVARARVEFLSQHLGLAAS
ncbi:peptidase S9 prolyl oligopeptidase active site domain protein [Acidimicrobium ferrooxidans DSM 10331]|uniref:Peptidase S9 prolyl oligopeptidase active site domain protein n=1 Tax=Acidimicrobium ferrooxidans (strain DSM 10331 / JCM 15462 / NBRC 103882 / ICP) TaxID=525909 RepID=C7M0L6_ACIFD|nr:prolyl oligopeptidase family serine peptidase [Acidimicrobium ferrooxidans]ACU54524.1 peptidase S9 prolyl oligopeptidase active site domain protein [Acidimicrobium ferrooxidans DSM 10331]